MAEERFGNLFFIRKEFSVFPEFFHVSGSCSKRMKSASTARGSFQQE